MAKPDSQDQLTVPSVERNGAASNAQGQRESIEPSKARVVCSVGKSLEGIMLGERYRVLERIGAGGMSEVYKAEHIILQKFVAIKVLHAQKEVEGIERFQQEAKAISSLDHRNIVKVYVFGAHEDRLYLAMDFLEGKSLAEILEEETRLAWRRVVDYAIQICDGLEQAHNRGIIHRDLKPSNIIIAADECKNEVVKIVDFGIAKITEESEKEVKNLTQDGNTCGSPPYMSPEQCRGETCDARSDVYSFGVMLYELLSGVRPISGRSALEMMENHIQQTPEFFKLVCPDAPIPDSLEAIVRKCIEKDCKDRYQSMADILKALKLVGSNSNDETELEAINQKAFVTKKEIESAQRNKKILIICIGGAILAAICSALVLFVNLPQKELNALQAQVLGLDTKDSNYSTQLDAVLPELLSAYERNNDKISGQTILRKIQQRFDAMPPSIEKWLNLAHLTKYLSKVGLHQDSDTVKNIALGGMQQLAESSEKTADDALTEDAYKQCIRLASEFGQKRTYVLTIHHLLAAHYMRRKDIAKAEHICRKAIVISKGGLELEQCSAYLNLGNVLLVARKFPEAEEAFRKSLSHCLNQYSIDYHLSQNITKQLAESLRMQGKLSQAKDTLTKIGTK